MLPDLFCHRGRNWQNKMRGLRLKFNTRKKKAITFALSYLVTETGNECFPLRYCTTNDGLKTNAACVEKKASQITGEMQLVW